MKMILCSAKVIVGDAFGRPYCVQSEGSGIRSFSDEVNRSADDNLLYKHPEDFALYRVGTFDDSDGIVVAEQHKLLVLARDMVIKVQ